MQEDTKKSAKRLRKEARKKRSVKRKQEKMEYGVIVDRDVQSFRVPNLPFHHSYFQIEKKKQWNVSMRIPHLRHLNHFWHMMQKGTIPSSVVMCFPNMKEISESMCAFLKLKSHMDQVDTVLSIGDGGTPRTGALLSCLYPTKQIFSIDPQLIDWEQKDLPSNLHVFGMTIEAFLLLQPQVVKEAKGIAIANVHSHAVFDQFMPKLLQETTEYVVIFALKCCGIQQSFSAEQMQTYRIKLEKRDFDFGVHSPERGWMLWIRDKMVNQ